jgi:branched-chain amino acid aminotransferase
MDVQGESSGGTQDGDPRNDGVLVSVDGGLTPREGAKVSVFDSGFVLGEGVWAGLRLIGGRIAFLDRRLDGLWDGAKRSPYQDLLRAIGARLARCQLPAGGALAEQAPRV